MTEPTSTPTSADLSVKFQEPTVAGLTGGQLSLFRSWEDERLCEFEDEFERRCPDDKASGSRFCAFHERIEETYDSYDCYVDRSYE